MLAVVVNSCTDYSFRYVGTLPAPPVKLAVIGVSNLIQKVGTSGSGDASTVFRHISPASVAGKVATAVAGGGAPASVSVITFITRDRRGSL